MSRRHVACIAVLLGVFLFGGEARAQPGIPPGPRVVREQKDLRFGTVLAGIPTSVAWSDPDAGKWHIFGTKGAEVQVVFVGLPSALQNGAWSLPISFSSSDAAYSDRFNGGTPVSFDPRVGIITRLHPKTGNLAVFIGGTVTPPPNQQPGDYVADIDLDVIYTGN